MPTNEKVICTLDMKVDGSYSATQYALAELKVLEKEALEAGRFIDVVGFWGFDSFIVSDFELMPMDYMIIKMALSHYMATIGLRGDEYYVEKTLLSDLKA